MGRADAEDGSEDWLEWTHSAKRSAQQIGSHCLAINRIIKMISISKINVRKIQIHQILIKCVHSPGIIANNFVFPAILVLIRIALSLHGTVSAKMPLGQNASLFKKIK